VRIRLEYHVKNRPAPVAAWSKVGMVLDRSNIGIMGLILASGTVHMSAIFCVVLSWVHRSLAMGRSPVQGILPKYLKGFTVSKVHSESEQAEVLSRETYNKIKITQRVSPVKYGSV
jgi:hypothetical protein